MKNKKIKVDNSIFLFILLATIIFITCLIIFYKFRQPVINNYGCGDEIPIVGVVGGNGKTLCVDIIADVMKSKYNVGKMNKDGITIDNVCKNNKSLTVDKMILDHSVDAAVLGLSCGYINRSGLGFNKCDVGIFLNNREPSGRMKYHNHLYKHICQNGCAIVNCDEIYSDYLRQMIPLMQCKIIYFCYYKNSPFLMNAYKKKAPIIYYQGSSITYIDIKTKYVFSLSNYHSRYNVEAIMAAIGCCIHMNFNINYIKQVCNRL